MKTFKEILAEKQNLEKIYQVRVLGNFYAGKFYEWGVDSIFVLSSSSESAIKLAQKNIDVITEMFKNKKYAGGKKALQKQDKKKIEVAKNTKATDSGMIKFHKVLTSNNKFEDVNLNH